MSRGRGRYRRGGNSGGSGCHRCGKHGHFARECPRGGNPHGSSRIIQHHQPRSDERRFFDKLTKDEDSYISSSDEAVRFMKAAVSYASTEGGPALLYRLNEKTGSSALRKSLEYMTSITVFEQGFLPLLERLAQDDLNKPVYNISMNSVVSKLYELPFLMTSVKTLASEWIARGSNDLRTVLAWFLAKVTIINDSARTNSDILFVANQLNGIGCGEHLKTILEGNLVTEVSLCQIRDNQTETPGGRHDNDKEDFRSISIVPTCQEFLSDANPYLPLVPTDEKEYTEALLLDRHFRLLREDILAPSKEERDDPKKQQRDIFYGVRPVSAESGVAIQGKNGNRIVGDTDPCIMFKFEMPRWFRVNSMKTTKEKVEYWDKNRRILPRDALVCLERRDEQDKWVPIRFGTIVRRETKDLLSEKPSVGIAFESSKDWDDTLAELSDRSLPPTRLFVVSADLFAYEPILRCLQLMVEIPFKHEIVNAGPSLRADDHTIKVSDKLKSKVDALDPGQHEALESALTNRVALIQGPPGTGKTFIGVLLAEIFLSSTDHTILVVTFTNHALDDVLESLIDVGIPDIVRMGGRSRSERLTQYNLKELGKTKAPFSREQTRRFAQLKEEIEESKKDIERLQRIISREIGVKWWDRISTFLRDNDPDAYTQLAVPEEVIQDDEGFRTAGKKGKAITKDSLWECWLKNKTPSSTLKDKAQGGLWDLTPEQRRLKKFEWQHELYEPQKMELVLALKAIKNAREELKSLQQITDAHVLSQARVIGCTTTKAAMCKSLLSGVNAGIVLVEEAAEILESHVLTSLNSGVKRLVMIGDHKQLRPKCQYYPLTVESNQGFNLNCSLFERLANANPISTLGIQHRMHPTISSIPRLVTYNDLQDASSTADHPEVLGIASRVVFIKHNFAEDNQSVDALESASKTNTYEREMVVQIVKYILKQGYSPNDVVVLTPYLGQMLKLQGDIRKFLAVYLDDRDIADARDQLRGDDNFSGGLKLSSSKNKSSDTSGNCGIRVATIDNYQGEESKIVVVSLVRSNPSSQIGFLKEPERVNVMLSRARDCEIVIGNKSTLESAKGSVSPLKGGPLWTKIFNHLDENRHIFDGLPVVCQNHNTRQILSSPGEFDRFCRDGGCTEVCGKNLDCGHPCPKNCHPGSCMATWCVEICDKELDCGHPCKSRCHRGDCPYCKVICSDICSRGHPLKKECGADSLPKCQRLITWICPLKHVASGPCYAGKFGRECEVCVAIENEEKDNIEREAVLNNQLTKKRIHLSNLKNGLEEKKKERKHHLELTALEEELALAQKEVKNFLKVEAEERLCQEHMPSSHSESKAARNVVALLKKKDSSLPLSEFNNVYGKEFKTNLCDDVNDDPLSCDHKKKRRKIKGILDQLSVCDVVIAPSTSKSKRGRGKRPHYVVQLRKDIEMPPSKQQKVVTSNPDGSKSFESEVSVAIDTQENVCIVATDSYDKAQSSEKMMTELTTPAATNEKFNTTSTSKGKEDDTSTEPSIMQYYESILPPSVVDNDMVVAVIRRYLKDGPIKADDLLDEMTSKMASNFSVIDALRFMLGLELNPDNDMNAPEYKPSGDMLTDALVLTAKAIDLKQNGYSLMAREFAEKALAVAEDSTFPSNWIDELNSISDTAFEESKQNQTTFAKNCSASEDWKIVLQQDPKAPAVMIDSILPMIGLEAVKQSLIGMYHRFKLSQEQGDGLASSYNVRFEGNPGTGKTTIARHYGLFLQQMQILPKESVFQETNGAKLIQGGVKGLEDILADLKKKGGGVVFVDEAYQLASDREGKKVLDFILPIAESLNTEYGSLVWIFAGYKKPLETLFEHNEGLPSRFPLRFVFEDYTDDELQQIMRDMMEFMPPGFGKKKTSEVKPEKSNNLRYSAPKYPVARLYPPSDGETKVCRFGLTWTFVRYTGWTDKYGNRTVDPDRVGTSTSLLVDTKGNTWSEDDSEWQCSDGTTQDFYPSSPSPIRKTKRERRPIPFRCDDQHLETAIKRLGRRRGDRGFGNARAVRVLFETIRNRQSLRITRERSRLLSPDIFWFTMDDLLGPAITQESLKKSQAWSDLFDLEGILPVKESVEQLFKLVLRNAEREKRGEEPLNVSLNRLFLGNPGTGKTTVAAIYGRILSDLGLLSKGEVVLKCASDFVGDALGVSEKTTQAILQSAEGCVLVIDEAYSLYTGGSTGSGTNDPYKTAVIDTIVEKVQAKPGADIAVVMIGYEEEMKNMMSHVNPGLSRRFQIDEAFHFPDFNDEALLRIMMASARKRGVKLSLRVGKRAVKTLARARSRSNFGNAGAVDNLLSKAITRMQSRGERTADELVPEDFGYDGDGPNENALDLLFDDLIGCKSIKDTMDELRNMVVFSQAQGKSASSGVSYNYLFLGNPGTGKTTVARKMGKMFFALGLLPGEHLEEAKASDLVTGYTGQAGKCTREVLRKSLGGTLFIDEAYQLDPARGGTYMAEAVDELVGALTEEEFKDKILVILAGYNADMENMLKINPGLKSRFSERVHFDDFDVDSVCDLLLMQLKKDGIPLSEHTSAQLSDSAQRLIDGSKDSFGNGRDVVSWAQEIYKVVARKYAQSGMQSMESSFHSSMTDVNEALEKMLESRRAREGGQTCATVNRSMDRSQAEDAHMNKDPPPVANTAIAIKEVTCESTEEEKVDVSNDNDSVELPANIFDSLSPDVLKALQTYIDEQGLGSDEGAKHLAKLDPNSTEFADLVARLVRDTGISTADARAKLTKWQNLQEDLEEMIEKEKQKSKIVGTRPIWRCAVCGQADKPWIVCYTAHFIVGYENVDLGGMAG